MAGRRIHAKEWFHLKMGLTEMIYEKFNWEYESTSSFLCYYLYLYIETEGVPLYSLYVCFAGF